MAKQNFAKFGLYQQYQTLTDVPVGLPVTAKFYIIDEDYALYEIDANGDPQPAGGGGSGTFKGDWDASTNTPTLINGVGTNGFFYRVSGAGSVDFGAGPISFQVNDHVAYSGAIWYKLDNSWVASEILTDGAFTSSTTELSSNVSVKTNLERAAGRINQKATSVNNIDAVSGNIAIDADDIPNTVARQWLRESTDLNEKTIDIVNNLGVYEIRPATGDVNSGVKHSHLNDTLKTTIDNKLDKNTPIAGDTKTKITYDTNGLVTNGEDATFTDITGTATIAQGGTGQTTQQAAINALTNVAGAANEQVLTKDTVTGDAIFKTVTGGVSPDILTTKGDTYVATAASTVTRQGVGADNTVRVADSTQPTGWRNDLIKDANIDTSLLDATLISQKSTLAPIDAAIVQNDTQSVINNKLQGQYDTLKGRFAVETLYARYTGTQVLTGIGDLTGFVTASGSIPNTSGVFTLQAGKTYSLQANVFLTNWVTQVNAATPIFVIKWVDATTNTPLDTTGGSIKISFPSVTVAATTESSMTQLLYTPSATQTVKLRMTAVPNASFTSVTVNNASANSGSTPNTGATTSVIIQQVGVSAITTMDSSLVSQTSPLTLTNSPIVQGENQSVINGKLQAQVSAAGSTTATMVFAETMAVNTAVQINNSGGVIQASKTYAATLGVQTIQSFTNQAIEAVTGAINGTSSPVWLDDNRVLTIYNTSSQIKARAGTVSGNTITYGSIVLGPAQSTEMISAFPMRLSGNNITIQLLQTSSTSSNNGAIAVSCPATTPVFGAIAALNPIISNGSPSICGCEVGVNKFLVVAGAGTTLFYQMGTLSGTTITYTTQQTLVTVSNNIYSNASVTLISTAGNLAQVLFTYTPSAQIVRASVGTLDLTTGIVTNFGGNTDLSTTANLSFRKVERYATDSFALLFLDTTFGGFDYCIRLFSVSGNTITLNGGSQRITTGNTGLPSNSGCLTLKSNGANRLTISGTVTGQSGGITGLSKRLIPLIVSGFTVVIGTPGGVIANSAQSNIIQEDLAISPNGLKYALGYTTDTTFNPSVSIGTFTNTDSDRRSEYFGIVKTAANAGNVGEVYILGATATGLTGFVEGANYYIGTDSLLSTNYSPFFGGKALSSSSFKLTNQFAPSVISGTVDSAIVSQVGALTLTNSAIAQGQTQSVINGRLQGQINSLATAKRYMYATLTAFYTLPTTAAAQDILNFGQQAANGITVSASVFTVPAGTYLITANICIANSLAATNATMLMVTIVDSTNNVAINSNFSIAASNPAYTNWSLSCSPCSSMIVTFATTRTIKMRSTLLQTAAGTPRVIIGDASNSGTAITIVQI